MRWVAALGAAVAVAVAAAVVVWRTAPRRPPAAAVAPAIHPAQGPVTLAHVGPLEITSADAERFLAVRTGSTGPTSQAEAVRALCDRALLALAAKERGISAPEAEVQQELSRKRLVLFALTQAIQSPAAQAQGAVYRSLPPVAQQPLAGPAPAPPALTEEALETEARADALATAVKRELVYAQIQVPRQELLAERDRMARAPSEGELRVLEERLRRERSQPRVDELLASLRQKWPVVVEPPP